MQTFTGLSSFAGSASSRRARPGSVREPHEPGDRSFVSSRWIAAKC
jgi:hypothetical protein